MVAAALFIALLNQFPTERRVLLPFDYQGVKITDGLLKRQIDDAKEFYLRIPNDDLLLGFRRRAGLSSPGKELGGWYSDDVFHIFGQILSGLARLYAATGDPACKAKAESLYQGWKETIRPDGFFYYSNKPNAPHYIFDKMVGGLVDLDLYCGDKDALNSLSRITDWAIKNLERTHKWLDGGEWYTLSENLYRAYDLTGNAKYKEFGKVWEDTTYWSAYAENRDLFAKQPDGNQTQRYHAYSHVNTLGGAAWAYRLGGEGKYLDTIKNAYDFLQSNEVFATGGFGPDESIVPKSKLGGLLDSTNATFETQCGSWAIFKLCKNLIALTGDAKYGDWIEQAAYNGVAATIPETPGGNVFYYSDYNPFGATKFNNETQWTCCAGTRPMAAADVDDLIYFKSLRSLDVNLFIPSEVKVMDGVTVTQSTRFPEEDVTEFRIHTTRPLIYTLRFRSAAWLAGRPKLELNGRPLSVVADAKHWLTLKWQWKDGDVLRVKLPMAIHSVPLYEGKSYPTALAVGPVVLASRTAGDSPVKEIPLDSLGTEFSPSPGEPLTYHLKSKPSVLLRPFYAFKEGEPYFLYLDPITLTQVPLRRMKQGGHWNDGGKIFYSNDAGAWLTGTFEGDSVKIIGWAFDDGGQASVKVDGKEVATMDQFGPGRDLPWEWKKSGFGAGKHTIRITVLGKHLAGSKDSFVNVGGLAVK